MYLLMNAKNFVVTDGQPFLREDVSIHRTNLKYCDKSPKIRFLSYFHILLRVSSICSNNCGVVFCENIF